MEKIFISGSIKIKNLHPSFRERLKDAVTSGYGFLVGDANGSDTSIQDFLIECEASDVTIYCSGPEPRNNLGKWPTSNVFPSAPEGTRAYFTAKDIQMADDASFGIMVWDSASTGTLSNVFELASRNKKSEVFVNKLKKFVIVETPKDIKHLVSLMSSTAFQKAEQKIGLRKKMDVIDPPQLGFSF